MTPRRADAAPLELTGEMPSEAPPKKKRSPRRSVTIDKAQEQQVSQDESVQAIVAQASVLDKQLEQMIDGASRLRTELANVMTSQPKKPHVIKEFLTQFDLAHQHHVKNPETGSPVPARINGQQCKTTERLLKRFGSVNALVVFLPRFFGDDDRWLLDTGYTVENFERRLDGYCARASAPVKMHGVTRNTQDNERQGHAAADLIRQQSRGR